MTGLTTRLAKRATAPVRNYFNARFDVLAREIASTRTEVAKLTGGSSDTYIAPTGRDIQTSFLDRVDVSEQNRGTQPPGFLSLQSRATNSAECLDESYEQWRRLMHNNAPGDETYGELPIFHRKVWEWAFITQTVTQLGLVGPGRTAIGFGVGNEPIPAIFASYGTKVLATDQPAEGGDDWKATNQLMDGLSGLYRSNIVADETLAELVSTRALDMNKMPRDLGTFDVMWSACVIEHLGSPQTGMDFVLNSCELLKPGGVAVHTTELELTRRDSTIDYGHCAVFRMQDFQDLATRLAAAGFEASFNFYVSMDTPEDRWVSTVLLPDNEVNDLAHLKLIIGDSVSTSYGIIVRRPENGAA